MKIFILIIGLIDWVFSSELIIPSTLPLQLTVSERQHDLPSLLNDACDSEGTFLNMRIENCTDSTTCNIITKREYNVQPFPSPIFVPQIADSCQENIHNKFDKKINLNEQNEHLHVIIHFVVDFPGDFLGAHSSNLVWKITAVINNQLITLVEESIAGEVHPGFGYTLNGYLAFGIPSEGLSFLGTYQIIDGPSERVESCSSSVLDVSTWHMIPEILSRIRAPIFPDRDFIITDYGAISDGETDSTEAFRSAITSCNAEGGGRVVVPPGIFVSGAITLLSNVNLHLSEGSTIRFSQDTTKYPNVFSRWAGIEIMNFSPFIYAFEAENIALTGTGVLDGNSDCEHWWPWKGTDSNLERLCGIIEDFPNEDYDSATAMDMSERNVPVEERIFGEGHYLRPTFVQPYRSKNVLIEDVTLINSPSWVLNPVLCENVIVRGMNINSTGPNSDGCNPESCKDVLIENVRFRTGDDSIAVKSGRNNDGRRVNVKSENILIQNCEMEDGYGGFTIGSEVSGGAQNIFCQNCQMNSPNLEQAFRFENNAARGGLIEDIFIRNIHIRELYTGTSTSRGRALAIDFNYEEGRNGNYSPVVRNVDIRNVTVAMANYAFYLRGFPNDRIADVRLYDCQFDGVIRPSVIEYVNNLGLFNVSLNGQIIDGISGNF